MSSNNEIFSKKRKKERDTVRWLLVFYDTVVYILCGLAVMLIQPAMKQTISFKHSLFYFIVGYTVFFGLRFLRNCYKQIWRFGYPQSFSKELQATVSAAFLLFLFSLFLNNFTNLEKIPLASWCIFLTLYVIASIVIRFIYYHLFLRAVGDVPTSNFWRKFIRIFGLVDFDSEDPGATIQFITNTITDTHTQSPVNELQTIIDKFNIQGEVVNIRQINKGYINRTYRIETFSKRGHTHKYTLQRINNYVFQDIDALMNNFKTVTEHLHNKLHLPGHHMRGAVHTLRQTIDGKDYLKDDSGYWRMLTYFDSVYSLDIPDSPETFYNVGFSFGSFLKEMSDININEIKEIIPNFHNTFKRYQDLEEAIALDPKKRVSLVKSEIEFIRERADKYGIISDALENGEIPKRICHNDCNLNNILFDSKTHLPVAIIDLDTVMPSSPLYDFGDSIRIGTNTAKDDEKDLSKVSCDLNLYEQYARGYLTACGDMLTKRELELLPYAALIITSEDGIRFLMDHINGDIYYNIFYPGQNLDRARTQMKMVQDMEKKLPEIKNILRKIYCELGLED